MDYNATLPDSGEQTSTFDVDSDVPSSTACHPLTIPSIEEYFTAFNELGLALFTLGGLAVIIVLTLYADTLRHIIKNAPTSSKTHCAFVMSAYPVVSLATYCATVVPRAQLLAEAVAQGMFMACLYQFFCLIISYCGGEAQLIKKVQPNNLSLKVAPCCCWPCCSLLPTFEVTKKCLLSLRMLVLQLPVVQAIAYMTLLVMWAEEQSLYQVNYNYFQPVVIMSILMGIWGTVMTMRMSLPILKDHHVEGKFIVLQLVLVFTKFQGLIAKLVATSDLFPCKPPITPTVYTNLIYNSAILWEMVILCSIARILYKKPLPEIYATDSNSNISKQISIIMDKSVHDKDVKNGKVTVIRY